MLEVKDELILMNAELQNLKSGILAGFTLIFSARLSVFPSRIKGSLLLPLSSVAFVEEVIEGTRMSKHSCRSTRRSRTSVCECVCVLHCALEKVLTLRVD